ncbi:hypothetical protein NLJ89_g8727 [Agrocybe chaxingu]|uniref:Uncharacterized protein n=1 Tax=Agrocybe chaxingu TaxID=84603 RepID=A0A9W8JUW2_9AGAR|nr:hypothetical protein NLJ89_g8727 [Agrocybe chaxingu]
MQLSNSNAPPSLHSSSIQSQPATVASQLPVEHARPSVSTTPMEPTVPNSQRRRVSFSLPVSSSRSNNSVSRQNGRRNPTRPLMLEGMDLPLNVKASPLLIPSKSQAKAPDDDYAQVLARQDHKCRNRQEFVAWFEATGYGRLVEPPACAKNFPELEHGDLFMNWIDDECVECQVWVFTAKPTSRKASWHVVTWGWKKPGFQRRLVITHTGKPSFVAESTWRKKYKLPAARIVTH